MALELDFAVLGPVQGRPPRMPGARTLGWDGFAQPRARREHPGLRHRRHAARRSGDGVARGRARPRDDQRRLELVGLARPAWAGALRARGSSPPPSCPGRSACSARCRTGATCWPRRMAPAPRSAGREPSLQVAKRQLEGDVPVGGARLGILAVLREEADVEHVLVGADLGHAVQRRVEAHAHHLRGLAAEHLLERALRRRHALRLAGFAQDAQDDRRAVAQREQRAGPGRELADALFRGAVQPVVVGGQVELAGAARDPGALLDRHQPVVLAQVLADLAGHREQRRGGLLDVAQHAVERVLGDLRVVAEGQQHLLLPLEFLQQVRLQVRAARHLQDLEQREQRDVVVERIGARDEVARALEQVLQAQQRADALVERVFVGDHVRARLAKIGRILSDLRGE